MRVNRGRPTRAAVYERLRVQIGELRERLGGLPSPGEAEDIWHGIWLQEAHHSTAIEGNTLVLKQVEQLLEQGRAVGNRELREYMEVRGYADAANWVYSQALNPGTWSSGELLSLTELRHIHRLALTPVWDVAPHPSADRSEHPGSFRKHDIRPFPGGMHPPPWPEVSAMVMDWIGELQALGLEREGIEPEALARVHARFEQIHPFLDGNGRTGRLVLNLLLVRLGYPPAIVFKGDRRRYLAALGNADRGDYGPLAELLARAILDNLHKFVVPAVAGPSRLVPLPALASERISANALRVAATRGRLNASKAPDGTWRSTRAWVDEYLAERYARARPASASRERGVSFKAALNSAVRAGLAAAAPPTRSFRVQAQPLGIRPDIDIDKAPEPRI
jgi:fido (protein-threonine AMPylation protein)